MSDLALVAEKDNEDDLEKPEKKKWFDTSVGGWVESFIPLVVLLLVWWVAGSTHTLNTVILPTLSQVVDTFVRLIANGTLITSLLISVRRVLIGFALSAVVGIALGIVIGLSKHMQKLTRIFIHILRPIPPIAWIPLVILWMGIGETSKIFLIFIGGFTTVLINVTDGIRFTDKKLVEVAKAMETPRSKYISQLVLPAALPSTFTGLRISLGGCWSCVVAAELVASSSGIGFMISNARNYGQMDVVIAGIIMIGVVGKAMDGILNLIGNKVLAWNE